MACIILLLKQKMWQTEPKISQSVTNLVLIKPSAAISDYRVLYLSMYLFSGFPFLLLHAPFLCLMHFLYNSPPPPPSDAI